MMKAAMCVKCGCERPTAKLPLPDKRGRVRRIRACIVCREPINAPSPWSRAIPTKDSTGKLRGSRSEARRGDELKLWRDAGAITELRYCNDAPAERYGLRVFGTPAVERLLDALEGSRSPLSAEHQETVARLAREIRRSAIVVAHYTPDFSYTDGRGRRVVEDVKGREAREWQMKKALMLACHEIEVVVPNAARDKRAGWRTR